MVGTMIATGLLGAAAAGTFAYVATAFVVNFALSSIVSRVFGQDEQGPQDSGTREQIPPSNVNAIPIVYGDAYLGGTFVDAVLSTEQQTMYYVLAVSCISPNGQFFFDFSNFYYGDRLVTFQAGGSCNSVKIENGGSGYSVGDNLIVSGGYPTVETILTVTQVSSGVITGVSINAGGSYELGYIAINPVQVEGGSGTGATFILGYTTTDNAVLGLTDEAGNIDRNIAGKLYINLYKSNAAGVITSLNGNAPNVVMGGSDIDEALRWPSSNRQMNGLAFAIVKLNYNQDAGTTNLSPITFAAKHYLNGTGAAKPGDVWYDYITNVQYGGAVDASFVNASSATALNAYADQTIAYTPFTGGSATQARYRMNGVLDAGQTVLSNLDKIMTCSDSWMSYNAALGQWSIVINKAETTAYAFDDDNIIGEVRVSATDITQSINQVEAKFPDKSARDQPNFVNIATPIGLRYPNEPDNKYSVTYDLCNDSVQAQYLANRILEQSREDLIVSFSTTYYGIQVDAGSVVSVTNSDYGWNNKLFRVVKVNEASLPDGSLGAKLEMTEYSAAVYDDFDITQYTPVPNSDLPSVIYFSPLSAPTITADNSDSPIPNFDVQTTTPATGRVTYIELYYTSAAIPTVNDWNLLSTAGRIDGEPITPGNTYTFENQVLPTGADLSATYYFSYIVGNQLARSNKSPTSASFTWTPTGSTGPAGDSVDIIFRRSATQPATPAPSVGTPALWYSDVNSVPAGSDPIWSSVGTNTGTGTNYVWQTPLLIEGQNGTDGLSIAEVLIYIRSASAPSTPTGGSYNFTTQTLTAPSGWSSGIPAGTNPVYTSRAVASIQGITGTDSALTWSSPVLSIQNGTAGEDGNSSRICYTKTTLTSLASTPTTITTTGSSSYPPNNSWGTGTVWGATSPTIVAGESVYQSDGVYSPTTNETVWNVPYLSTLKVGSLSAISANLGTITTGQITNTSYNTTMELGSVAGSSSSGATLYFERTGSASSALGPIIYGNDISTSKTSYSYAFSSNVGDTFIVYSNGVGGSYNGTFQVPSNSTTFTNLAVLGGTTGPGLSVSQQKYNGTSGNPVNPAGNFTALDASSNVAANIKLASGTGYAYYIAVGVAGPFTGAHDGLIEKTETIVQGDIVVDGVLVRKASINDTLYVVTKSTAANQCALGVFNNSGPMVAASPPAGLVDGYESVLDDLGATQYIPIPAPEFYVYEPTHFTSTVNSIGEGQINVCGENGDIAAGDLIVTSNTPGKGMKQSDDLIHSYTVAKAREPATFSSPTEVKMIACIYVSG
jgi:hypothetical protein